MLVLQVPQLHLFIKCQQKAPAGQTLYRNLSLHIYGRGKINLDSDMEKPGRSGHLPEGTGYKSISEQLGSYAMFLH